MSDQADRQGSYSFIVQCVFALQGYQGEIEGEAFVPFAYIVWVWEEEDISTIDHTRGFPLVRFTWYLH